MPVPLQNGQNLLVFLEFGYLIIAALGMYTHSRQRKPSVKTLRSALSVEFWRHCVLSGGTPLRFASIPERRIGNINLNKHLISSSGYRTYSQSRLQSHFVPLHHDWPLGCLKTLCFIFTLCLTILYWIIKSCNPLILSR